LEASVAHSWGGAIATINVADLIKNASSFLKTTYNCFYGTHFGRFSAFKMPVRRSIFST
jgi:hypothetical protein